MAVEQLELMSDTSSCIVDVYILEDCLELKTLRKQYLSEFTSILYYSGSITDTLGIKVSNK